MNTDVRIECASDRIARLESQVDLWRSEHDRQQERELSLRQQVTDLTEQNRSLAEGQAAAEQRVGQLAQLQAALSQLHEAQLPADVLTTIKEIVANLIGSEEMGIYARNPDGTLTLLDGIGVEADRGGVEDEAIITIPLHSNGRVVGVIALFKLLPQKAGIEPADHELFALLSAHAARALHHAGLRTWARSQGVIL